MKIIRWLLFPFSILHAWIIRFRNYLYDIGYKRSIEFIPFTLCVGNLSVGGSGKTPTTEWLIKLLASDFRLAVLSRGYGRKSRGYRKATAETKVHEIGDEPFQMYHKFAGKVPVHVGEERALAIPEIVMDQPDIELIILDDAYQHRAIHCDFKLLLTPFHQPFFKDFMLPTGNLRENRSGAKRADLVLVTKCPEDLSESTKEKYCQEIRKYSGQVPVYFIRYSLAALQKVLTKEESSITRAKVVACSAIADPGQFETMLADKGFELVDRVRFLDHLNYKQDHIRGVLKRWQHCQDQTKEPVLLIITEKDHGKWLEFKDLLGGYEDILYFQPLKFEVPSEDEMAIKKLINRRIREKNL